MGAVKTGTFDRTGILIVRLWIEGTANGGFRARISQTHDAAGLERGMTTAGTPEDLYDVVRNWVETFIGSN